MSAQQQQNTKGSYCLACDAFLPLKIAMKHVMDNLNHGVVYFDAAKTDLLWFYRHQGVPLDKFKP